MKFVNLVFIYIPVRYFQVCWIYILLLTVTTHGSQTLKTIGKISPFIPIILERR
jgi:hypothetical protein